MFIIFIHHDFMLWFMTTLCLLLLRLLVENPFQYFKSWMSWFSELLTRLHSFCHVVWIWIDHRTIFFRWLYLKRRKKMKRRLFIIEHWVLMEYETRAFFFLEKLQLYSQICCFDVFLVLSWLDFNFETSYE
jgi:hypothetical protein